jgi:hypothetical protein
LEGGGDGGTTTCTEPGYVAQAGLKLAIFLPLSPECFGYRCAPPYPAMNVLKITEDTHLKMAKRTNFLCILPSQNM